MRWVLDDEQDMFRGAFASWLDRVAGPESVREQIESGDPSGFERHLVEEGWLAVGVPEDLGGQGGGLLELALAAEQLARHTAPSSAWLATALALPALDAATTTTVIEDGLFAALAVPAGSPIAAGAVTENGESLSGIVPLVLGGDRAALFVVPASGRLFLVEADAPGVTVTPTALLDGSRSAATVTLEGAAGRPLDADADAVIATAAMRAAVLAAADSLGAASRMLELAVQYSRQRTQFGRPIGSFQAMKHAAATMLVGEEASRSVVYYAAASVDAGLEEADLHAAAAKAQVTRAGNEAAESALTMHGAIGYTWEHELQLFYKRAKLDLTLFGEPTVWNERIAERLVLV